MNTTRDTTSHSIIGGIDDRSVPALRRLPPHLTACACCGATCSGAEPETVTVGRVRVTLGRCDDCTDLDVLDVAGLLLDVDHDTLTTAPPGPLAALRYSAHVEPGHAAVKPWSHLVHADLLNARRAVAVALRRRLLTSCPPVHVAPPTLDGRPGDIDSGCLLCGIGTVPVSALTADRLDLAALGLVAWRHVITSALAPTTVRGWLCPDDAALLDEEGATGVALVARSMRQVGLLEGDGLPARLPSWAMLRLSARRRGRPSPPPNEDRWGHVPIAIRLVDAGWPPPLLPCPPRS